VLDRGDRWEIEFKSDADEQEYYDYIPYEGTADRIAARAMAVGQMVSVYLHGAEGE